MRRGILLVLLAVVVLFLLQNTFYALGQRAEEDAAVEEEAVLSDEDVIQGGFSELIDVYYDEDLDKFLSYFSEDDYPGFTTLEEDMETTFENNDDLVLNLTYLSTVVEGDGAVVRVDWTKNWDDSSTTTGKGNTIRLKKIEGMWKITDLEDSSIFTIGAGTVSGSVTDR